MITTTSPETTLFTKKLYRLEFQMQQAGMKIGLRSNFFIVPKILSENAMEYLNGYKPLRKIFNKSMRPLKAVDEKLYRKIGFCLRLIHESNEFNGIEKVKFPKGFFREKYDMAYVHSDYSMHNILVKNDRIAIIDWSLPERYEFKANYAPKFWDLMVFVVICFHYSPTTLFSYRKRDRVALSFLDGYGKVDKKEFANFVQRYNTYFREKKLINMYSKIMLNKFLRRLI